jgi:DinB superfamily
MNPEPWLRGPIPGVSPLLAPSLYALEQAREDLTKHTEGLTPEQVWARPFGLAPLGFQLRHISGSIDRLATYLDGRTLSPEQLKTLEKEMEPGASREELLVTITEVLNRVSAQIRAIDPATLTEPRYVGRNRLPSTVNGLLVHVAEHTQRHVGQAITASQLVRNVAPNTPADAVPRA